MKAIVYQNYGPPDVLRLEEIEMPTAGDNEVLIKVRAASVNPLDWHFMRGTPYIVRILMTGLSKPKNTRLGVDVSGQVESVGRNVTQFKPGDEVFGTCHGAFAEYVCTSDSKLAIKPANVTFGADVTGVCSTTNVDMVRSIGADRVVDYTREDFTESGQRYDLIFDAIGNHSLSARRRILSPKGICVMAGGPSGRWQMGLARSIRALVWSQFSSQKLTGLLAKSNKEDLTILHDLMETGKVKPVIDRQYKLSEVPDAIRYLEEGHARGKVVITL